MKCLVGFQHGQFYLGPKKVVLFRQIDQVKKFFHLPGFIVESVSEYIFLFQKNKQTNKHRHKPKTKETIEEKTKTKETRKEKNLKKILLL